MTKKAKILLILAIAAMAIIAGTWSLVNSKKEPGKLDAFAQCLGEKGAAFYGAFWCPHCQNQKAMFGNSENLLPYVECSTPDGQKQTQVCIDKGIKGYPTWEFKDGSRLEGEIPLETLAAKTACALPK